MKNLFLSVLALIVLAGTIFAPSNAWSGTLGNETVCFMSEYSVEGGLVTAIQSVQADKNDLSLCKTSELIISDNMSPTIPMAVPRKVQGVTSSSISCQICPIANKITALTVNGIPQKRAAILLC